jgi:hypothetical protein
MLSTKVTTICMIVCLYLICNNNHHQVHSFQLQSLPSMKEVRTIHTIQQQQQQQQYPSIVVPLHATKDTDMGDITLFTKESSIPTISKSLSVIMIAIITSYIPSSQSYKPLWIMMIIMNMVPSMHQSV